MRLIECYLQQAGNFWDVRNPHRLFSDPLYAMAGESTGLRGRARSIGPLLMSLASRLASLRLSPSTLTANRKRSPRSAEQGGSVVGPFELKFDLLFVPL